MTTAYGTSLTRRIRLIAVAAVMAASLAFPVGSSVVADGGDATTDAVGGGLSISVESVDQLTGLTAVVVAPDGAPMHGEADAASDVLSTIPSGAVIALRIDTVDTVSDSSGDRWWPVMSDDQNGWVLGSQLAQATTADGDIVSTTVVPFEYTNTASADSTAKVFGGGQNVNVRADADSTSEIVTKAGDGDVISLRIDQVDSVVDAAGTRWWPVTVNGIEGWISGSYLQDSGDAPTSRSGEAPPVMPGATVPATEGSIAGDPTVPVPSNSGIFAAGTYAQVFTGNGDTVNVRTTARPDGTVSGTLTDGEVVRIVSGPVQAGSSTAGWYEVTNANVNGFVDGDFLITSVEAASTEAPRSEGEEATAAATETPVATTAPSTETPALTPAPATTTPAATKVPSTSNAQFMYPLKSYTVTQKFGCSSLGFYTYNAEYGCAVHNGLDLAAPAGTDIMAAGSGTVITAGWCNCGLGYYVEIDHGNGIHTLYGHMASQPYVRAGQLVTQGDVIGPVGSTGISTGPHTHFMVTVNGKATDPLKYLP